MENLGLYLSAFSVSVLLICVLRKHAARVGLVDYPCERKRHCGEVPLIGGVAIFAAFTISLFISHLSFAEYSALLAGSVVLVLVGVVDDIKALPSKPRFLAQIIAAGIMCAWGGVVLRDLGVLTFDGSLFTLGSLAIPFTIFATVGVINAMNMSDGIDGLSGSLSLVTLTGLALISYVSGTPEQFIMVTVLMSAVAAFLFFNVRFPGRIRALVFLGDAGSMFLGFALTWFVVSLSQGENRIMAPVTALWFLAMPLFDAVGVMLRRILKGHSPFRADREHFHHVFQLAGFSVFQTQLTITAVATVFMAIGLAGQLAQASEIAMFYLFLGLFSLYFWGMMRAWKVMRFLHRTMRLEKDAPLQEQVPDRAVLVKNADVKKLRTYYMEQKNQHSEESADMQKPVVETDTSKVALKLVVNTKNHEQTGANSKPAASQPAARHK